MNEEFDLGAYYPILAFLVLLIGFAVATLVLAHAVGPRKDTKGKQVPYESGMDPIGDARQRFDIAWLTAVRIKLQEIKAGKTPRTRVKGTF